MAMGLSMSNDHTVEKFDPKTHDPLRDPPPQGPGIPQVVEDKLDIVANLLGIQAAIVALGVLLTALASMLGSRIVRRAENFVPLTRASDRSRL